MGPFEDDQFRMVLAGILVIVDSWKMYLTLRNINSIMSFSRPPAELDMGPTEFSRMQNRMIAESANALLTVLINLGSRLAKLSTNYYAFLWRISGNYGENLITRTMWFSAFDAFIERGKFLPVGLISLGVYGGVDPFLICVNTIISAASAAVTQALGTYFFIVLSDKYGPSGVLKLALVTNLMGLLVVAVYIGWLVPKVFKTLPDDEAGRSVSALASSVGYPTNSIFVDETESLPNAFYSNAIFSQMIIITKSLTSSLNAAQLTSVVAHELGHWKYCHPHFMFIESIVEIIVRGSMWTSSYANDFLASLCRLDAVHPIVPVLLMDFFIRPPVIDVFKGICKSINTRFEYAADDYACRVWDANHLREALVKMTNQGKSYPLFDSWFCAWFFGHPTTLHRIQRIDRRGL